MRAYPRSGSARLLALAFLAVSTCVGAEGNPPGIDFMLHCQGCHLADGSGLAGHVPRLQGQVSKFLHSEEGRAYLLRVPGVAQSALSDQRLAEVMNWTVRRFDPEHLPADFTPYGSAEVGHWRQQIMRDLTSARLRILEQAGD